MLRSLAMNRQLVRRFLTRRAIAFAGAFAALGCGDKGAVTLTAQILNPTLSTQSVALGTSLNGSFELRLDLGPEASNSTSVTPGAFAVRNASGEVTKVSVSFDSPPPYELSKGGSKSVTGTLDATKLVDAQLRDALCAGQVWYAATLTDTLSGNTTAQSAAFSPTCN